MKRNVYRRCRFLVWFAALTALVCVLLACETGVDSGGGSIPLARPLSIQLTARDRALVAQWTKVAPAQGIAPTYEIYWNTAPSPGGSEHQVVYSGTSNLVNTTIENLENGTAYYVWVKAFYEGLGESDYTEMVYAYPIPPPETPDVTVYSGEAMLDLAWNEVDNAFTYEVYYGTGSGAEPPDGTPLKTVSVPGAVISGLNNGTAYTLWVRSVNTAGKSEFVTKTGTPQAASAVPGTAPGNVTVSPGDGKLTLTWAQVREGGTSVPGYTIYYGGTDNLSAATAWPETIPADAPTVSTDITGLGNDTAYYVWVKSRNPQGESAASSSVASGVPKPKPAIVWTNSKFELGKASADFIFAQDLPPSVFFPDGRPNTDRLTRVQETALGNLFSDGAAWYLRNKLNKTVDFVFFNGGYIDNALLKGDITVGSLSAIVQPDSRQDRFYLVTLTGAELKKFFRDVAYVVHTGRGGPHNTGFFGIVSGEVSYTIEYPKAPPGTDEILDMHSEPYYHGRIKEGTLKINGADIVDSQDYTIGTTDYLAAGEYFTRLVTGGKNKTAVDIPFWRGVAEYIYDKGIVTPKLDEHVKVEGGVPMPLPWTEGTWTETPPANWGSDPFYTD